MNEIQRIRFIKTLSQSDLPENLETNLEKTAQVSAPEPRGGFLPGLANTLDLFGRQIERGIGGYTPKDYIPNSHGEINAFADWANTEKNKVTDPKLKYSLQKMYDTLVKAKNSIVTLAQRISAPYEFKNALPGLDIIRPAEEKRRNRLQIDTNLLSGIQDRDYETVQERYYNWIKTQKNIYNESKYASYLSILDSASVYFKALSDPKLQKDLMGGKVKPTVTKPTEVTTPGGAVTTPSTTGKPKVAPKKPVINVNEALANSVFVVMKSKSPKKTEAEIYNSLSEEQYLSGYLEISKDSALKENIIKHIKALKYDENFKAQMIKKLDDKIQKAIELASGGGETPTDKPSDSDQKVTPGQEPAAPSPFPSEMAPSYAFLEDEISKLNLQDKYSENFLLSWPRDYKKFIKLLKNSYEARKITPAQYDYLKGELTGIEYEYRAIASGER